MKTETEWVFHGWKWHILAGCVLEKVFFGPSGSLWYYNLLQFHNKKGSCHLWTRVCINEQPNLTSVRDNSYLTPLLMLCLFFADVFPDHNECKINNGGCSHTCRDQPLGFLCECPDNMRLVGDTQCEGECPARPFTLNDPITEDCGIGLILTTWTCATEHEREHCAFLSFNLEVDTCLERDVCDQLCVHVNSSLTCDCYDGYHMNPASNECEAKGEWGKKCIHNHERPGGTYCMCSHSPGVSGSTACCSCVCVSWITHGLNAETKKKKVFPTKIKK